jgi:type III pantothenate kinase
MLLAVNIANAGIDLGVFDSVGALVMKSKIESVKTKTSDEYAVVLNGILKLNGLEVSQITDSIISSVVPPLTATVAEALRRLFHLTPLEVGPGIKTGLNIKIDSQVQLGADLVANAVAAMASDAVPFVIVDIGTATTFTVVDAEGILEGVIICPGVRVSLDALSAYACQLPDVSISKPKRLIAKNTSDSMNSGVLYGHAFMIDGFIAKIAETLGVRELRTVVTGDLANIILPLCESRDKLEAAPDLTLTGLRLLWLKNKK